MLKPYDSYKPSGILWVHQTPSHWEVCRAKHMFVKMNRSARESDDVITCFRDGKVTLRKNRRTSGFTESIKEIGYQGIRKGDLVIHVMDAFAGAVGVSDSDGKGTPVYSVCQPMGEYNTHYYAHIVRRMAWAGYIQSLFRGIRQRSSDFRFEVFGTQLLPIPPRAEQDQIVRFLDNRLAKINRLIKAKKRQIELLKELKQTVITHAITRSLDHSVPLKDSGVAWLGKIPEHWNVVTLKRVCSMKSGDGITALQIDNSGQYPVYGGNGLRGYTNQYTHQGTYILIGRQGALCGNVHVVSGSFWASEHAVVLSLTEQVNVEWFAVVLTVMNLNQYSLAAAQPGLAIERIINLRIPLPSASEQRLIATYLQKKTTPSILAIISAQRQIDLLIEYRTRLISDVVTGQIDVSGITVPEEPCQAEDSAADSEEPEAADGEVTEAQEVEA